MYRAALIAAAWVLAGSNMATAMPAPVAVGQALAAASDGLVTPVQAKKKAKKSSTPGAGDCPPEHKKAGHC